MWRPLSIFKSSCAKGNPGKQNTSSSWIYYLWAKSAPFSPSHTSPALHKFERQCRGELVHQARKHVRARAAAPPALAGILTRPPQEKLHAVACDSCFRAACIRCFSSCTIGLYPCLISILGCLAAALYYFTLDLTLWWAWYANLNLIFKSAKEIVTVRIVCLIKRGYWFCFVVIFMGLWLFLDWWGSKLVLCILAKKTDMFICIGVDNINWRF